METDKHLNELAYNYSESIYHIDDSETVLCEDLEKAEQAKEHFKNGYKMAMKKNDIKGIGKYAAACASSFDPDIVMNMVDGYSDGYENCYKTAKSEIIEKLEDIVHDFVEQNFYFYEGVDDNNWGFPYIEYGGEDDDMRKYQIWDISNKLMDKIKKEL